MEKITIKVLDFTEYPGPRYIKQGFDSGEKFYQDFIKKEFTRAIEEKKELWVDLDFTAGFPPSFIDETFGNLVYDFPLPEITKRLKIKTEEEPDWNDVVFKKVIPNWKKKLDAGQPRKPQEYEI